MGARGRGHKAYLSDYSCVMSLTSLTGLWLAQLPLHAPLASPSPSPPLSLPLSHSPAPFLHPLWLGITRLLLMQYSPGAHLANSRLTIAETGKIKATARQSRMGKGGRWRKRAWADKEQSRAAHKGGMKRGEGERGASLVCCLSICKLHNNSPPVAAVVAATAKLQVSRCNVLPKLWVVGRGEREGGKGGQKPEQL